MATQTNNLLLVEAGITRTLDATNDDIQIGAATTFTKVLTTSAGLAVTGDATVSGNLEVTGDIVSRGSSNLLIQDPIIDLAVGNSGTTATPGGFTVQMNRNSGFTAGTVTTFVAGVPATSAPTFTYTDAGSSTLLVAGDIVAITGSSVASNDGLYVVQSVSGASFPQTVTIKGIGGTAVSTYTPFAQNQFTASTGNTASAFKIDLAVGIFADGTSAFKDGGGGNYAKGTFITAYKANATDSDFSSNGAYSVPTASLQDAYVSGNTITTSGGDGDLVVAGTEKLQVTATNGVEVSNLFDLNGSLDADVTTFEVDASGAISLDSTSTASNFTLTANDAGTATLTIAATNSGAGVAVIDVDADGALNLTGGAASKVNTTAGDLTLDAEAASLVLDGGEAAVDAVRIVASNASGGIDVDAGTGGITVDTTGAVSISAAATSDFTVAGDLILESTGSGITDVKSAVEVQVSTVLFDVNASGAVEVDAAGAISLDSTSTASNFTLTANDAGTATLTISATNSGAGVANLDVDADGAVEIDAVGAVSLGAGAASDFTVSTGDLSLTATASSVNVTGGEAVADAIRVNASNAAGGIDIDAGTGGITIDTTGALSLDSTALASNLTLAANSGSTATLTIAANNAGAGTANLDIDAKGLVTIDGSSLSFDGTVNSNLTVTGSGQSLTLSAAGGGAQQVSVTSAGTGAAAVRVQASAGGIDIDASSGGITVDTTGVLSLDGQDTTNLSMSANAAGSKTLTIESDNLGAGGATLVMRAKTTVQIGDSATFSSALIEAQNFVNFTRSGGLRVVAGETLANGDAVVAEWDAGSSSVRYFKAANNAATDPERNVHGVAQGAAASAGTTFSMCSISGLLSSTALTGLTSGDVGKTLYLGTGGALTTTAPTASGTTVFKVGYIVSHNGGPSSTAIMLFQPQFIAKNP